MSFLRKLHHIANWSSLVKVGMDPWSVSDDFALLVRQAPISQLLMAADFSRITDVNRHYRCFFLILIQFFVTNIKTKTKQNKTKKNLSRKKYNYPYRT
jgi:hypothetical protein